MIVRVISGLAVVDNKILMGKRPPNKTRPMLWELLGGKMEANETPVDALKREWLEEAGIKVEVGSLLAVATFDLERRFVNELYAVRADRITLDQARAIDHTELTWVRPWDAMKHMPCAPGFYSFYPAIRDWMDSPW
jgi:8-oxo-dGTP diphosphatase